MEIKTHVLTNEQHLNDTQKLTARKNIGIKVEDVKNSAGESLVDEHGVVTIPDGVAVDPELSPTSTNPVQNKVVTAALNGKVDKVTGKDLSTNDYTNEEKRKLASIEAGAEVNVQADWEEEDSSADGYIQNKPTIPTVNDGTLSIQVGSAQAQTFTANQAGNTSVTIPLASQNADGLMSSTDKTKLDGIEAGAEVNVQADWEEEDSNADSYIQNKPTIPTVNDGTLSIQVGSAQAQTFTANQAGNTSVTIPMATQQDDGLMSSTDKTKLDGIAPGAEVNVQADWEEEDSNADSYIQNKPNIPTVNDGTLSIQVGSSEAQTFTANQAGNTSVTIPMVTQVADGLMSSTDKTKLDGIAQGAEVNVQSDWEEEDSNADSYIQNKPNIPVVNDGTLSIQVGSAQAQTFTANQSGNTSITIPLASQQVDGLMSSTDKTKLDGIDAGAEVNVQADWTESDNTADSFIQHKPTDLWHGTPTDTELGNVVTGIERGNDGVPVIHRDNTVMAVPVPDTNRTLLEGKSDGSTEWNVIATSTFGASPEVLDEQTGEPILDEQTGEPILDENATDLWATYDGIGFGAERAVADRNGQVIDETYATKTDVANKADKVSGATSGNFAGLDSNGNLIDSGAKASDFKPKQTAVTDPTAIGSELEFIDSITQDADGVMTPTKKTVQDALTTQKGVVQLADSVRAQVPSGTSLVPTEAAVRTAIDSAVSSAYHHAGTKKADELLSTLLVAANEGNVYNISEAGTTTADFIEDAGHVIRVGDNVGVCQVSAGVYKFDLLSGIVDLSNYKTKQTAVVDPTASGNGLEFIDSISQDANGEITPTKKTVQDGTTSQKGVVQLEDSHTSTSTTTAATPNSVKEAYDLADGKQDPITFDGTYDATTNPAATVSTVTTATANKADKVTGATSGNFAGLDGNGNLTDSGSKAADFATSAQGTKADSAIQGVKLAGASSVLTPDQDNVVTIPNAVPTGTGETNGLMSASDKDKLDGIEDGAEVNVIESIEVNGVAQTVTNKNVDLTIPAAANNATITINVDGAAFGETAPVAGDFSTDQGIAETITIPAAVSATQHTPAQPGVMSSADKDKLDGIEAGAEENDVETISIGGGLPIGPEINSTNIDIPMADYDDTSTPTVYTNGAMAGSDKEKLDNLASFSSIQVTSGSTTGQVDAASATDTLNLVAGDNITITANNTTKTIEISASLSEELGFLSGTATVNGIVHNGDVLTDPLTGLVDSNNGRFIIDTDTDDGHVYLYALKSIPDLVNGVDLFTISVNSNVSRTTANGFYGVAGLEIRHKDNGSSLITESTESYASQVGECSVDMTVTIKNSTGTVTTIDGVDYYGYLIRYAGDSTASGDAINVVTRISVIEETVGIVEYNGSQSSLSAGNGISIDNDNINANLGDGLGLDDNNNIEVKVGAGLKIDITGGVATVAIDNVTEEVVEEVQKLGEDLDKKITTTFPYAQITTMSDYMTYGTQGENRMFGQLFSVPITSEIRADDTVICVNALQAAPSIDVVFGIFEYDFSANNGAGSTYWLADTGVVHVSAGDNAFPIQNIINDVTRPSIELKSSCLYYVVWAIHNTGASNGLSLASCPGYGANYNAIPRYTVKTSGASVQVNWAGDGCLRSSWFSGYNEDNSIPRLFMMVRNKSDIQPSGTDPFIDITDYDLVDQYTINKIFGSTAPSADGAVFQKVIPARAVNITKFEWADTKSIVTATSTRPMVMDNSFGTTLTLADGTLTTAQDGDYYVHTFTPTNALAMTAGTVYWLPAQYNTVTETGMSDGGDNKLVQYNTNVARRDLQMIVDMAQPSGSGEFKASQIGAYLKLYDDNNNSWVI